MLTNVYFLPSDYTADLLKDKIKSYLKLKGNKCEGSLNDFTYKLTTKNESF